MVTPGFTRITLHFARTKISKNFAFLVGPLPFFLPQYDFSSYVMTANTDKIEAICECQYTIFSSDGDPATRKDNFNDAPIMHEIDEDDSESEKEMAISTQTNPASDKMNIAVQDTKDASEDESAYTGESFCSDESCDESEMTNVTPGSLVSDSFSLLRVTDLQRSESSKAHDVEIDEWKDGKSCSPSDEQSRATTADRFTKPKRYRRWNMSFTDEEMRRIERENELLLRKIMAQQKPRHRISEENTIQSRISSSAINRKKLQKKIQDDNMLLLRRIQQAKSCVLKNASKMGCRLTFL